jgi:uncharacterized membrane protein YtjA (UPF0391 family)
MLPLTVGLLVMALIAGLFGYGFIASSFMAVAQILFFVFLALAALSFFFGGRVSKRWQA